MTGKRLSVLKNVLGIMPPSPRIALLFTIMLKAIATLAFPSIRAGIVVSNG